jgi:hypothetical protein
VMYCTAPKKCLLGEPPVESVRKMK